MEINFYQVLFQALNFGVILWVLTKYLYKPVLKLLDDRAAKINEGMAAAERNLKASDEAEKTKKSELAKARKESAALISKAESEARAKADTILAEARRKAKEESTKILADAQKEVAGSKAKLEKEAATLGAAMVKAALAKSLSTKEIESITSSMLKSLK